MQTGPRLRPEVVAARERLSQGREKLKAQHESGSPGVQVCAHLTDLLDEVLLDLYRSATGESSGDVPASALDSLALVAHGGYGRRDMAPYSDVDLMVLYAPGDEEILKPFVRRLTQGIYDCGLDLGFAARTPQQALSLALKDATIFTSLAESRHLGGNAELFQKFHDRFRRDAQRRAKRLIPLVEEARRAERRQFGETVYLLEPNIKRSRGGLRDIQLVRWVGFTRYGEVDLENLYQAGVLSKDDREKLRTAREFLLRLRNELHFHAGKSCDVLDKTEQLRLAELFGYTGDEALLPVEKFMRDYFHHTGEVRYTVTNLVAAAKPRAAMDAILEPILSHQVEGDFRVGPNYISATRRGLPKVRGDLAQVLRLMDLANLYNKRIDNRTWEAIRLAMSSAATIELSKEATDRFLSLLSQPAQLGTLLRRLHQLRALEKLVPAMSHARCLLQFNEYHKYTVDEHSIRAVEQATDFQSNMGLLGEVYRGIKQKRTLHLALLLHDLGKGYVEDHSEVGRRLALETARSFHLPQREGETLAFLVHKHLYMAHLAFWRNIDDPEVVVQFAVEVGSPEVLQMLYVLTCADVAAVGPGVLNDWKLNLLSELYRRTLRHVGVEGMSAGSSSRVAQRREDVRAKLTDREHAPWYEAQLAALPLTILLDEPPKRVADILQQLRTLPHREAVAWGKFNAQRNSVEYAVGTYEEITPGIFHKLTGALTSQGLQILSAEINTLAEGLVLDRFHVHDGDFNGEPPATRLDDVTRALTAALQDESGKAPVFRKLWNAKTEAPAAAVTRPPTRVEIDNSTSEKYTIIDVFTLDRMGLLYTISRAIFELGLSVSVAKIGTHLDQVVDVFYTTDAAGRKIEDETRLSEIRMRLMQAIESSSISTIP